MNSNLIFAPAVALLVALTPSPGIAAPTAGGSILDARDGAIQVRYEFTAEGVEFSSRMPAGWSFTVAIDGDQNGIWGVGPLGDPTRLPSTTSDRAFGQSPKNGVFCAQYILAANPQDPTRAAVSSTCGKFPSQGRAEMGGTDDQDRGTITFRLPMAEVFGEQPNAHLQVCIWDTQQKTCHFSPSKPFVLMRPAVPSSG